MRATAVPVTLWPAACEEERVQRRDEGEWVSGEGR